VRFVADLHVHSRYSRACSRDCDLEQLAWWAARKGIGLIGTGDLCHPAWAAEIREKLVPAEPGLFRLRPDLERDVLASLPASVRNPVRFQLSVEISTIYKRGERTRKVHHLLYAPDLGVAGELTRRLERIGNVASDGRPILGLDSRDLLETLLDSGEGGYLVPAHVWTPWFAALGSKSGFDSIADCYADLADHIFAIETGLSSDPSMNHRVSSLDRYRLVSNSDAHSPPALGREATVLSCPLSYEGVRGALETGAGLDGTIEFFPEEGKYHLDGHRTCDVRLEPEETRARDGRCPVCAKPVTVGVLHRVSVLADRPVGYVPAAAPGWRCLVQLPQVVGELIGVGPKSKAVEAAVSRLVDRLGPELGILQDVPLDAVAALGPPGLDEALRRLRAGEVVLAGGYDGEYGVVRLFEPKELADLRPGTSEALFDLPDPASGGSPEAGEAADPAGVAVPAGTTVPAGGTPPAEGRASGPNTTLPRQSEQSRTPAESMEAAAADGLFAEPERVVVPVVPAPAVPASVLDGLDAEQRVAAEAAGPVLVVAGPGTGKTRTLTTRIAHLVGERGVPAAEILALTFTRRAAAELSERLAALLPRTPLVTTFHGLGLRIVREQAARLGLPDDVRVVDEAERLALAREAMGDGAPARDVRRLLDHVSVLARDPQAHDAELTGPLARYRAGKRARGLVDLDDLLARPVALLAADPELAAEYRRRWPHVSVDEYQDVDPAQYALLRLLVPPDGDLCVIGDPDQAIYSFRGADVGFFLRFAADFPGAREVRLTRNYRSTAAVVDAALAVVAPATLVPGRALTAVAPGDGPPHVTLHTAADEAAEAAFVIGTIERVLGGSDLTALLRGAADPWQDAVHSYADFAVLYRTDAQAAALVDALEAAGVPYQKRSHHRLGDQPGVRDLLGVLREDLVRAAGDPRPVLSRVRAAAQIAIDRAGGLALLPPVAAEAAGPGEIGADRWSLLTPATARAAAAARAGGDPAQRIADLQAAVELLTPLAERAGADAGRFLAELALGAEVDLWDPRADRVSLLTLHASKGLEFPVVFVVGCEDGLLPMRFGGDRADPDEDGTAEERRLLFVGMTRARTHLSLSGAARRTVRGRVTEPAPSPFLADLPAGLVERTSRPARRRTIQLRLL
jgi:DNA helicase II / ATP-dependent DNA helicase PcrA